MIKRLFILAVLALSISAWAMPESLQKLFHTRDIEKHVVVLQGGNKNEVSRLDKEGALIAVVQLSPDEVTDEVASQLMTWVQNGGSLWFQDCRIASRFGMQAAPLTTHEIGKSEERSGKYAGHKIHGLAALGFPASSHSVLTDVDAVAGFLLPVGNDQYSAVQSGGDVTELLRVTITPGEKAASKAMAAIKPVGKGFVVFKPLVWVESVASDRFQANLEEFVCGYKVPTDDMIGGAPASRITQTQSPSGALDQVHLSTGEVVAGTVVTHMFKVVEIGGKEMGADYEVDRNDVTAMQMAGGARPFDSITMRDGKTVQGMLEIEDEDGSIDVKTADGHVRKLRKMEVDHIDFGPAETKQHGK